jgi:hypothetical protein
MVAMFCRKVIPPILWLSIQPKTDELIGAIEWERKRSAPRPCESQRYRGGALYWEMGVSPLTAPMDRYF